jgi:hypothetical protein
MLIAMEPGAVVEGLTSPPLPTVNHVILLSWLGREDIPTLKNAAS